MSKITTDDLNRLITEETAKFIKENRDEIVRRAWKRLQELKGSKDATVPKLP